MHATNARPIVSPHEARLFADADDPLLASGAMIRSLHLAICSAAHPDCPACHALLPVLAAYLAADGIGPPPSPLA